MTYQIDNVLDVLPTLAAGRFRCCVTSPPYWGLRDYGHPDQLGLEPTPAEYVERMVRVFREVRRTLTDDGTLWLNVGDSYAGQPGGFQGRNGQRASRTFTARIDHDKRAAGLKAKDMCGIPWRLAFGLQDDGWYLRSDIIWHKPNPMPESVKDRPTKAHEYVFLLSKSPRYFYDYGAAAEDATGLGNGNKPTDKHETASRTDPRRRTAANLSKIGPRDKRSARSVWSISSRPFKGAHFAVMPPPVGRAVHPRRLGGRGRGARSVPRQRDRRHGLRGARPPVVRCRAATRLRAADRAAYGARTVACEGRLMRCLTDAILCEPAAIACRYDLPTGGAAVRAWVNPLSEWGARLASACRARCGELLRGRARPFQEPTR